jgi:hypothetical protein
LLSLSSAAKEAIWWRRFFSSIHFDIEQELIIHYDNLQTIRMLTNKSHKLSTKLRHIDIHQHWLRQEVQSKKINLKWIPTAEMAADGLTKALPKQKHDEFCRQLNLLERRPTDQSERFKSELRSGKTAETKYRDSSRPIPLPLGGCFRRHALMIRP